jgi:hypothetical protein
VIVESQLWQTEKFFDFSLFFSTIEQQNIKSDEIVVFKNRTFKGSVQRDVRGIEGRLKKSMLISYIYYRKDLFFKFKYMRGT